MAFDMVLEIDKTWVAKGVGWLFSFVQATARTILLKRDLEGGETVGNKAGKMWPEFRLGSQIRSLTG